MRQIKFRAWHEADGGVMLQVGDTYGTRHPLDCCRYSMEGQPVTLMQFTGLHDANGVEIYEGDVVGFGSDSPIETNGMYGSLGSVVFWKGCFCVDLNDGRIVPLGRDVSWVTVYGNIHESPELLEPQE